MTIQINHLRPEYDYNFNTVTIDKWYYYIICHGPKKNLIICMLIISLHLTSYSFECVTGYYCTFLGDIPPTAMLTSPVVDSADNNYDRYAEFCSHWQCNSIVDSYLPTLIVIRWVFQMLGVFAFVDALCFFLGRYTKDRYIAVAGYHHDPR